ncbi:MAG: hypothetical protein IT238_06035 [Bacteroidia bacterium]|nr:hypothetical protein [Bacteroidia bacterium]MCZ2249131.1 hypothetical protein [Bacteroidia bacterium]
MKAFVTIYLICLYTAISAQTTSSVKTRFLPVTNDTVRLDTLSIIPGTFKITDDTLQQIEYILLPEQGLLVWKNKASLKDSIKVEFQTYPFLLSKKYYHKSLKMMQAATNNFTNPYTFSYTQPNTDIFKLDGFNRSGSITRGVSFGNNQDVVVNSNLNLQLSGKISENLNIKAVISDDNIPIQPEGNTQQLQEFDKVFIELSDEKSKLIAGDFVLSRPRSYFMNYYKRNQGGMFNTQFKQGEGTHQVDVSAAVSKGKFSRNTIIGIEGNQGPYRLKGTENESFIMILSGSENIYIDGQLLQRGQENDYVIDYNTAEIIFTAKRIITKDKRIVAEFQYIDRNYARSLLTFGYAYNVGKIKTGFHIYSEQDNKNKPVNLTLSSSQKDILRNVGDSLNYALSLNIDTVSFSSSQVLYEQKDTTVNGILYSKVFIYSINPEKAVYRPSFSNVGQGNGNYINISSSANGKVFQWVAPLNGVRQGSFEPVILLPAPKQRQMAVGITEYQINKHLKTGIELAVSNNDENTFSTQGDANNLGYGAKYYLEGKNAIGDSLKKLSLLSMVSYEIISRWFTPIERYRTVEFERDWNRVSSKQNNQQQLATAGIGIEKEKMFRALYKYNSFIEKSNYQGQQHVLSGTFDKYGFNGQFDGSLLGSTELLSKSEFLRHKSVLTKKVAKRFTVGVSEQQEKSSFKDLKNDSLLQNSFHFFEWQSFVNNTDSSKNTYEFKYINRTDWLPVQHKFNKASIGESYIFSSGFNPGRGNYFKNTTTYRTLDIKDTSLISKTSERSMVNRVEYGLRLLKGVIAWTTFYEIGSGSEVKKEYSFLEVAPGQGAYYWKDYNNNGIKEINEFENAIYSDQASYIKVYTPTNEFVKTLNNQFNQTLNVNAPSKWSTQNKNIRKLISRFSNQTNYRIDRKTINTKIEDSFNPFSNLNFDSTLVSLNSNVRSSFYFNRLSPKFGIDYTYQEPRNRLLLTNGYESKSNKSHTIRLRYNITRELQLNVENIQGIKTNKSDYFNTRDYHIKYQEIEPKISYQPNTQFRLILSYKYSEKLNNNNDSNNVAINNNMGLELRYNEVSKGSFNLKFNYIRINYNSNSNTPIAFEMLEALLPGNNITWNIGYQRTLANNMQINFNYDGRKTKDNRTIHTGGVQVRAFF